MRIIVLDDEELARLALVSSIKKAEIDAQIYDFGDTDEALEFLEQTPCDVAFLDIEMPEMSGVEVAKRMQMRCPGINIIFATGYGEHRGAAFELHASGYLMKPVMPEDVRRELKDLRRPVERKEKKRVRIRTFGNFSVLLDGVPVKFKYERTRELLAYLVDRSGALCSIGELNGILFEDEPGHESYLKKLRRDLLTVFEEAGCGEAILQQRGKLGIDTQQVDCDYYNWRSGSDDPADQYRGEYMAQYSWAEVTQATLQKRFNAI